MAILFSGTYVRLLVLNSIHMGVLVSRIVLVIYGFIELNGADIGLFFACIATVATAV